MKDLQDAGMARVKSLLKRYPRLYQTLTYIFGGWPMNTTPRAFVEKVPQNAVLISVGSGPHRLRKNIINVDIFPFEEVDVVADSEQLPFESGSVDAAVYNNVLEHVRRPNKAVAEMVRVLKPGGIIYGAVPFIIPYHSSPDDFYRWSEEGMRQMFYQFDEIELEIQYGPSAAFTMMLCEWLALLFSFNTKTLYTIVLFATTIITAPLKLLDYLLVHYKRARNMPLGFYFIGTKKMNIE